MNNSDSEKSHISVVIPVYGCGDCLPKLYTRLNKTLCQISASYEIIMVNDASPDNAWDTIKFLAKEDNRVKGINLSRNFGQHYAITAGLDFCNGDWTVVMDCDLQDQPEEILKLYEKKNEGFDIVIGQRGNRQDTIVKKITSRLFYLIFNYLTDSSISFKIGNFGIYSRKVTESIKKFRENNRAFGFFVLWSGFSRAEIEVLHGKRTLGKSSYTFSKRFGLAFDSIVAHSNKPLKLSVQLGFLISFSAIAYSVWLISRYFIWANPIEGWTSLIVSLYFLAGLIIANIGMTGLYIGKVFDEVKRRPLYIIKNTTFENN